MRDVLILEDVPSTRAWLCAIVAEAFPAANVAEASTVRGAIALCQAQTFDLALVDLHLPDGLGVTLIECLKERSPDTRCVVATIYDDDQHLFPALQAGAEGFLLKERSKEELTSALEGIVAGRPPLSPSIARRLLRHFRAAPAPAAASLSPRETDVLSLVGRGLTRKEIASVLEISPHTTHQHIKAVYRKLSVSSRAEAAIEAARRGLV